MISEGTVAINIWKKFTISQKVCQEIWYVGNEKICGEQNVVTLSGR